MINPTDFWALPFMRDFVAHYGELSPGDRNIYYDALKYANEAELERALKLIYSTRTSHPGQRWRPEPADLLAALDEIIKERSEISYDELERTVFCEECGNIGRRVEYVDGYQKEVYCTCIHGMRWKKLRKKQGFVVDDAPVKKVREPYRDAGDDDSPVPF